MKSALVQCGHLILELQSRLYADLFKSGARDFSFAPFFLMARYSLRLVPKSGRNMQVLDKFK